MIEVIQSFRRDPCGDRNTLSVYVSASFSEGVTSQLLLLGASAAGVTRTGCDCASAGPDGISRIARRARVRLGCQQGSPDIESKRRSAGPLAIGVVAVLERSAFNLVEEQS